MRMKLCRSNAWLPIGTGAGMAIGVATGQLALWLAIGIAIGVALDRPRGRDAC